MKKIISQNMKKMIFFIIVVLLVAIFYATTKAGPASIKVYVQWAQANPKDWNLVDTAVWSSLPTKSDPVGDVNLAGEGIGDSLLDNVRGYVFSINVQGVTFRWYDHYAIDNSPDFVTVTAWRDDPILFPVGQRQATVGIFKILKFDAKVGQINTDQSFVFYREGTEYTEMADLLPENATLKLYSEFVVPPVADTKPGIYVSDAKWDELVNAQTFHGWRE